MVRMGRLELPFQASEACALSVELHAQTNFSLTYGEPTETPTQIRGLEDRCLML